MSYRPSTWSQNEGKYLYFMGIKEFLPESDFVYGLRTVLCDASSKFWHLLVYKWK